MYPDELFERQLDMYEQGTSAERSTTEMEPFTGGSSKTLQPIS